MDIGNNKKENINSLLIALFLCARLIVQSLPEQLQINNILVILLSLVFIIAILNNNLVFNIKLAFVFSIVILAFSITFLFNGLDQNTILYLINFLIYGGLGLYLSGVNFSINRTYKYIIYISIILLPFIVSKDYRSESETWMGISYSILPLLFAGIIYISTVKDKVQFKMLTAFTMLIYLLEIISIFTRGALIALLLFVVIFTIVRYFRSSFKRNFTLFIVLMIIWFVYNNLEKFLTTIYEYLLNNGLHIRFIEKTLHLMSYDNLLNGRNNYYELAINGIKNSPVFGNGIGSYETDTGLIYVHNLFLQLAYEGGLIFIVPCAVILICGIYIVFSEKVDKSTRMFIWFIYSIGIFRLLVSSVYWREQTFWYLLGLILLYKKSRNKSEPINDLQEKVPAILEVDRLHLVGQKNKDW